MDCFICSKCKEYTMLVEGEEDLSLCCNERILTPSNIANQIEFLIENERDSLCLKL